jgi:hypothetical protein
LDPARFQEQSSRQGFNRLLQVDTERECQCEEAAAFFVAYSLGLPVFSFQPNALEAAVLATRDRTIDTEGKQCGHRLAAHQQWYYENVGVIDGTTCRHGERKASAVTLILSDPREAAGLLTRLEKSEWIDKNELWWTYYRS